MNTQWGVRYKRLRLQQTRQCFKCEHEQPLPHTFHCSRQNTVLLDAALLQCISYTDRTNNQMHNSIMYGVQFQFTPGNSLQFVLFQIGMLLKTYSSITAVNTCLKLAHRVYITACHAYLKILSIHKHCRDNTGSVTDYFHFLAMATLCIYEIIYIDTIIFNFF